MLSRFGRRLTAVVPVFPVTKRCLALPAHQVVGLPALSPTMTAGSIGKWIKKAGEKVSAGDTVAEIQTDKASIGFDAQDDCYIAKLLVEEGQDIACGTPIMVTVEDEASIAAFKDFKAEAAPAPAAAAVPPPPPAPVAPKPVAVPVAVAPVVKAAVPTPAAPVKAATSAPVPVESTSTSTSIPSSAVYSVRWGTGVSKSALINKLSKDQLEYIAKYGRSGQKPLKV